MKGQISVEFLAAGLIFIMGVVFVINVLTGSLPEYLDQKDEESINVEMKRISGHLIKKEGELGWTSSPNSADNIGLATEYMVVNESKIQSLEDLNYLHFTETMDLDHTYNFNFTEYPVIDTSSYFYKNSTGGENADLEIVTVADASASFSSEWNNLCGNVNSALDDVEEDAQSLTRSFYSPGMPSKGQASLATLPSGGKYDWEGASNVPSCVGEYNSVTSSYGKGVTEWESNNLLNYNPSRDAGSEAWGVMGKWILENHDWNNGADAKHLVIIGDQDPTGGGGDHDADWLSKDTDSLINSEVEIADSIISLAENKDVIVHLMHSDWEYDATNNFIDGDNGDNDAKELMERIAEGTGGSVSDYSMASQLDENIEAEIRGIDVVEPDYPDYEDAGRIVHYGSRNFTGSDRNRFLVTSHDGEYDTIYTSEDWNFSNSNTERKSIGDSLSLGSKEYIIEDLQNEGEYQGSSIVLRRHITEFGAPITTDSREVVNRYVSYDDGESLDLMRVRVTGW